MEEVMVRAVYRHFKGNYYYVESIGKSSETREEFVIYRALYDTDNLWIRPLNMFLEEIDINRPDNVTKQKYRFELVKETTKDNL